MDSPRPGERGGLGKPRTWPVAGPRPVPRAGSAGPDERSRSTLSRAGRAAAGHGRAGDGLAPRPLGRGGRRPPSVDRRARAGTARPAEPQPGPPDGRGGSRLPRGGGHSSRTSASAGVSRWRSAACPARGMAGRAAAAAAHYEQAAELAGRARHDRGRNPVPAAPRPRAVAPAGPRGSGRRTNWPRAARRGPARLARGDRLRDYTAGNLARLDGDLATARERLDPPRARRTRARHRSARADQRLDVTALGYLAAARAIWPPRAPATIRHSRRRSRPATPRWSPRC